MPTEKKMKDFLEIEDFDFIRSFYRQSGEKDNNKAASVGFMAPLTGCGKKGGERWCMNDLEFTKLVRQYDRLIFTVCNRFVRDYQEAENLTQETFLTAFRAIDNFVGSNYKPWLVRIATNKCKDFLKSAYYRTTEATEQETLERFEDSGTVYEEVETSERVLQIRNACDSLKPPYREVALLHFIEDKSFDEISLELNRPLKTVQTQGYRARDKLQKMLKEEIGSA